MFSMLCLVCALLLYAIKLPQTQGNPDGVLKVCEIFKDWFNIATHSEFLCPSKGGGYIGYLNPVFENHYKRQSGHCESLYMNLWLFTFRSMTRYQVDIPYFPFPKMELHEMGLDNRPEGVT